MSIFKNYPHLATIALSYAVMSIIFFVVGPLAIHKLLEPWGTGGIFIAGMMYTYSFTASIAAFILPTFTIDYSPATIAIIGGIGSTLVDVTLLHFIRSDMKAEMKRFGALPFVKGVKKTIPWMKQKWFRTILGLTVIALPIPDEIGIALMANSNLSEKDFRVLGLIVNMIGIYALVSVVGALY